MPTKVLNVAEKPSVAKEISSILSKNKFKRSRGFSQTNPIYSFPYKLENQSVEMVVTSVRGHLTEIEFPERYGWNACSPDALFEAEINRSVPTGMKEIEQTLKKEAKYAGKLVLWLDCDREGENISFEVMEVCLKVNPSIKVLRAHFSSVTPRDIYRAINNLGQPNKKDSEAVEARKEIDLRIGAAFTRFQTRELQTRFSDLPKVVSYGPCQFPTLGFVVERYRRVKGFTPEKFWTIECIHEKDGSSAQFNWSRTRLFDRLSVLVLYEMCLENPEATVTNMISKQTRKWKPFPLSTVQLQKLASQKLRLGAEQTMQLAESLYNEGLVSYPRTETDRYTMSDNELKDLIQLQTGNTNWGEYSNSLMTNKYHRPRAGKNNDKAHPPIHPTKHSDSLSGRSKDLYELIVRHFLASCSNDAIGNETKVTIKIGDEEFTATGLMITERNYLDIWRYDKWSGKTIPVFRKGEKFTPTTLQMKEGTTTAPQLLSESELISVMDKNGIGTDATIAQHIKTIQARNYARKLNNSRFEPTQLGLALVEGYDAMQFQLSRPNLRAKMEFDMNNISRGQMTREQVLESNLNMYKSVFMGVMEKRKLLVKAVAQYFPQNTNAFTPNRNESFVRDCPKCDAPIVLKQSKAGKKFLGCKGFPLCSFAVWIPNATSVSVSDEMCSHCSPSAYMIRFEFRPGQVPPHIISPYTTCVFCDDMDGLVRVQTKSSNNKNTSSNYSSNWRNKTGSTSSSLNQPVTTTTTISSSSTTSTNSNNRSRKNYQSSSPGSRSRSSSREGKQKTRKCRFCGQEGHDRRTCPQRS